MSVAEVEDGLTSGLFYAEDGTAVGVLAADCSGLPRDAGATFTHFQCFMTFSNRGMDDTTVHILPGGELFFVSSAGL